MYGKQSSPQPGAHHPMGLQLIRPAVWAFVVTILMVAPEVALAQGSGPWEGTLQEIIDIMTGTPARLLAIIVVAALGFAALFGRMSWSWAGSIIGGITLIFGAATIVGIFEGAVS